MENRMAILGIFIHDIEQSEQVNALLHTYGQYIIGRFVIEKYPSSALFWTLPTISSVHWPESWAVCPVYRPKHNTGNKLADFLFLRRVIYT